MNTLHNHIILFDAECPICTAAAKFAAKNNFVENEGNAAYQEYEPETCYIVDKQRAVNEIALIDKATGEVVYGIESLFKILAANLPLLRPLLLYKPFVAIMRRFYGFFSYNRRVILPIKASNAYALQPTFKLYYRIAYLLFAWFITALILTNYVRLMYPLFPTGGPYREYLICGGQLFFQAVVIVFVNKNKIWDYWGNLMTISLGGALLLLPALLIAKLFTINPLVYILYFLAIAGLMFLEHIRRAKLLDLGWLPTITWVSYRVLVLVLIMLAN